MPTIGETIRSRAQRATREEDLMRDLTAKITPPNIAEYADELVKQLRDALKDDEGVMREIFKGAVKDAVREVLMEEIAE